MRHALLPLSRSLRGNGRAPARADFVRPIASLFQRVVVNFRDSVNLAKFGDSEISFHSSSLLLLRRPVVNHHEKKITQGIAAQEVAARENRTQKKSAQIRVLKKWVIF
ncbi:hypothetical protein [Paraburkholderia ribeironis]|uniref:hypothetical protein n=1 Tax=Paraburkholderia ribeironis TaxID=1247936 RepID=UPI001C3F6453|nr:hypothetical protein [Paraburkholderia ribeironis]